MIKNAIFDIGGVLTAFDPNDYLSPFGFDDEKSKALNQAIFKNDSWKDYMIGKINKQQFKQIVLSKNPDLKNDIEYILADENTNKLLPPLKEGIEFLKNCKRAGLRIFILSNIVEASLEYFKSEFTDVTSILEGGVYSCEVGMKKPDKKIYEFLLKKYDLKPEECVFFDDTQKNIDAACELGFKGLLCAPLKQKECFKDIKEQLNSWGKYDWQKSY